MTMGRPFWRTFCAKILGTNGPVPPFSQGRGRTRLPCSNCCSKRTRSWQTRIARVPLGNWRLGVAGRESLEEIRGVLTATSNLTGANGMWIRMAAVSGVAIGLELAGSSLAAVQDSQEDPALSAAIVEVLAHAPTVAGDMASGNLTERIEAIRLLSWVPREAALSALDDLLSPDEPAEIQLAAVRSLAAHSGQQVGADPCSELAILQSGRAARGRGDLVRSRGAAATVP